MLKKTNQKVIEALRELKQVREVNVDNSASSLMITVEDVKSATPK